MTLYRLRNLTQRFNGKTVLDIGRLEIESGRIHALLGPNGAGKSTLLAILAFLEPPASGEILFQGAPVDPSRGGLLALRRRVVLVDQHPVMFSTTVSNNIAFGLKIRKIAARQRQRVVDGVLAAVGLERYREARAHTLSGGETQRLALARALALDPEVLLCDEPTAGVDAENQAVIRELLRQINTERGATVLFATHDRLQAASLAHRTVVLENGRLADSAGDNRYTCIVEQGPGGEWRSLIRGLPALALSARPLGSATTGVGRITIDPEKIRLLPSTASGPRPYPGLPGRVVMVMDEGRRVRVVVDVGVLMVVLLSREEYCRQPPLAGGAVTLVIPEDACSITG